MEKLLVCMVMSLVLAFAVFAQDPGEPGPATYDINQDFQYRIDEGEWTTFVPSSTEEKLEALPVEHWWVKDLAKSPVMDFIAEFEDTTVENPRCLQWGIDTSSGPILKDVRHQLFYVRWRNRAYVGTPYEIVGPWSEPSDYVRVVKLRPSGRVIAIKPR